jgi:hypothetical protein
MLTRQALYHLSHSTSHGDGFFQIQSQELFAGALHCNPPDLCLLSSKDYRITGMSHQRPADHLRFIYIYFFGSTVICGVLTVYLALSSTPPLFFFGTGV